MTRTEFIKAFDAFPKREQVLIAKKIQAKMADELFEELDRELPDVAISMTDIASEVKAHRHALKKDD
ncbi:hypothetical protein [Fibrella aestuarina]|uniref:hypothetical protein n=1 Tax=Fibrella aestuarina TaxID=651143 RepID=UPI00059C961F|nr:hypothetical protein [Fibrella aestuarina]